ncbi:MAG TPA: radical SAM protein [Solirubrobacterales bacterium]|nr:radical SAM protein [Solirubrobacterales bacterium]
MNRGCNLRCWYCTENGENRFPDGGRLSAARLLQILGAAYESGVRCFRFTGGEPTHRRSLPGILRATQALGDDVRVAITTNGARLEELLPTLADLREPMVFLSVDGIDPTVAPGDSEFQIEKWLTPRLVDLIDALPESTGVRLNYVLTASSVAQLDPLLEYSADRGIDLKVFELLLRDFYYAGDRPRLEVFREQYIPVRGLLPGLRRRFGRPRPFGGTGGNGIPMWAFDTGNSRIVYFDSAEGSHYGAICRDCPLFPCQEGLYALVLDANGVLHPAGCTNKRLRSHLGIADQRNLLASFRRLQAAIAASTLQRVVPDFVEDSPYQPI